MAKTSTGMSRLLANASKMEKEIKETENVAPTINTESEKSQEEQEEKKTEVVLSEDKILSEKKDKEIAEDKERAASRKEEYGMLFQERKIKDVEIIRISKETHAKLKKLANAEDVSMHVLATNILEMTFQKYNKEIQAAIKKYMNL